MGQVWRTEMIGVHRFVQEYLDWKAVLGDLYGNGRTILEIILEKNILSCEWGEVARSV
jgi:hypothetical protein